MNAHTPGPWRYCKQNGSPTTGMHMIAGGKPGYLAEVRDCGSGIVEANARLIAAAPDLLNALWVATEHNALHFGENHNTVIAGRAAIAKARGEA